MFLPKSVVILSSSLFHNDNLPTYIYFKQFGFQDGDLLYYFTQDGCWRGLESLRVSLAACCSMLDHPKLMSEDPVNLFT